MRQIKFRGKRVDNGEWVVGSLIEESSRYCIFESGKTFLTSTGFYTGTEVDPTTVVQFTGLLDKNGKEIYEGDVVHCYDHPTNIESYKGDVFYKDASFCVRGSMIKLGEYGTVWTEILGNIHDNPSLLTNK